MLCLLLFILFGSVHCIFYPNIQVDPFPCSLKLNGSIYNFERSSYSITYEDLTIYFSPCMRLERLKCSKTAMLCVKTKSGTTNFERFSVINSTAFEVHHQNCQLIVSISQELQPDIFNTSGCRYILKIPNPNLKSTCTKEIDNQTLEFYQIPGDLEIVNSDSRVIVNLCQTSKRCKDDVSSVCILTSNGSVSLGHTEKRVINYGVDRGVEFHFKTNKDGPSTVISLTCDWTALVGHVQYQEISRKKHKITIHSYLGCVKLVPNCIINFENYIYNLTSLSNSSGWNVSNNFGKNILINICGPLVTEELCPDHSQVCHYSNGLQENYGTSMTTLTIDGDNNNNLKTSFKDGSACPQKLNQSLSTNLNLICSFEEKGPVLKTVKECLYKIDWETPKACPILVELNSTPAIYKPCTVTKDDITYNLSGLTSNLTNHVIHTPENLDYIINICRSIIVDNDSNCQPTMGICSKNNSEPNIKQRFFNIGNVQAPTIENGQLVLQFKSGSISNKNKKEASAVILFNCSDREVGPIFAKGQSFAGQSFEHVFTWETKHACPILKQCILSDAFGNNISFTNAEKRIIKFLKEQTEYTLDICSENMTSQQLGASYNFTTSRTIFNNSSDLYIQYTLNTTCQNDSFNIIHVHPKCEHNDGQNITSNGHNHVQNIKECVLKIDFKHPLFCGLKLTTPEIPITTNKIDHNPMTEDPITVKIEQTVIRKECTYQYHGTEININALEPLTVISPTNRKYTIGFNHTANCRDFICRENEIIARLDDCPKARSENDKLTLTFVSNLTYVVQVSFRCEKFDDTARILKEGPDIATFQYPLEEVCFETHSNNLFYIIGSIICVLVVIFSLLVYKKDLIIRKLQRRNKNFTYVYCKNSED